MARPDVGDDRERGPAGRGEAIDLVRVVHAELADEHLGVLGRREHREREADEVVEVAGGGVDAGAGGDARAEHVLGRGLAHRPRHADDGPGGMAPTPLPREAQEELLAVVVLGAQHGTPARTRGVEHVRGHVGARDDGTRTGRHRPGEIGVAVHLLASEGDEDRAGLDGARVDDDLASYGRSRRDEGLRSRRFADLLRG